MNIDEAIKRAIETAELNEHIADTFPPETIGDMHENCRTNAQEKRQIAEWLTELKRLQSLEYHVDTYEINDYTFEYHEMCGLNTIAICSWDKMGVLVRTDYAIESSSPMSHDDFVDWCKRWYAGSREKGDDENGRKEPAD